MLKWNPLARRKASLYQSSAKILKAENQYWPTGVRLLHSWSCCNLRETERISEQPFSKENEIYGTSDYPFAEIFLTEQNGIEYFTHTWLPCGSNGHNCCDLDLSRRVAEMHTKLKFWTVLPYLIRHSGDLFCFYTFIGPLSCPEAKCIIDNVGWRDQSGAVNTVTPFSMSNTVLYFSPFHKYDRYLRRTECLFYYIGLCPLNCDYTWQSTRGGCGGEDVMFSLWRNWAVQLKYIVKLN